MKRSRLLFDAGWLRLVQVETSIRDRIVKWVYCSRKTELDVSRPDAVVIVPFVARAEGVRLIVTREYRVPLGDYEYGLPSGLVESGETVELAAKRELAEETGYQVRRVFECSPPSLVSSAGLSDETFQYCFVHAEEGEGQRLEATEDIEVLLLSLPELKALCARGVFLSSRLWPLCHGYSLSGSFPALEAKGDQPVETEGGLA